MSGSPRLPSVTQSLLCVLSAWCVREPLISVLAPLLLLLISLAALEALLGQPSETLFCA